MAPSMSQKKKSLYLQRCSRCFVTDTGTVAWECASSSLEMNNWGFQQVPLLQHQESKNDSALFLLLWPQSTQNSSPFVLKHLCQRIFSHTKPSGLHWAPGLGDYPRRYEGGSGFQYLREGCFQHRETATLYPSETESFHLSRVPLNRGNSVVVPWKFLSGLSSFGSLITGYFRILLCDGYSHIIPLACMRTDSLQYL